MGTADGVEPGSLEMPDAERFGVTSGNAAQQTVIVVNAGAPQFDGLPVEAQPLAGVQRQCADAEGNLGLIRQRVPVPKAQHSPVQRRGVRRPQRRGIHRDSGVPRASLSGLQRDPGRGFAAGCAVRRSQRQLQP